MIEKISMYYGRLSKSESAYSFGIFRILFFLHLLFMWYYTYVYRHFEFNAFPGFPHQILASQMIMLIWLISILMMIVGMFTRYAAIVNYLCVLIISEINGRVGVATFYNDLMRIGSLICIFMPVSKSFSVDMLMNRLATNNLNPQKTNYLNYLWSAVITVGILYLGAAFSKLMSPIWMSGLGLWLPCSLPYMMSEPSNQYLMNQEYFMYFINYFVIGWEMVFIFLLFFRRYHSFLIITGITFHLLIAYYFNFPRTSIGVCFFYVLLIPEGFWKRLYEKFIKSHNRTSIYVPANTKFQKAQALLFSLDFRNKFDFVDSEKSAEVVLNSYQKCSQLLNRYLCYKPLLWLLKIAPVNECCLAIFSAINQQYKPHNTIFNSRFNRILFTSMAVWMVFIQVAVSIRYITNKLKSKPKVEFATDYYRTSGLKFNVFSMSNVFLGVNSRALFMDRTYGDTAKKFTIVYTDNHSQHSYILHDSMGFAYNDLNLDCEWTKINYNTAIIKRIPDSVGMDKILKEWFRIRKMPIDSNVDIKMLLRTYPTATQFEKNYYQRMVNVLPDTIGNVYFRTNTFVFVPK